jgi:hypothetical protein
MKVTVDLSALSRTRWSEYVSLFIVGGAITALAGIIATHYGPRAGGLFLAFPAIFPSTATLIEKHEKRTKVQAGGHGTTRGRKAAALDAAGAMRRLRLNTSRSVGWIRFADVWVRGVETDPRSSILGRSVDCDARLARRRDDLLEREKDVQGDCSFHQIVLPL